jgi:hypothetical protein
VNAVDGETLENKRRLRISLRSLLVAFTIIAVAVAWASHAAHRRSSALAAVRKAGGNVRFMHREPSWLDRVFGSELLTNVREIDLRDCEVVDRELLKHVAAIEELRVLDLSGAASIGDAEVKLLVHLPLEQLWLQATSITDDAAPILSRMKALNFLQLNSTNVTDEFLERLKPLPRLNNFGLRGTSVTSRGMKFLKRHPALSKLDLYHTVVDDEGVEHLTHCQALSDLGLSMTKVTSAVFQHLAKLPNLTDADLSANREVTTEAVLDFEKSHPKCDIEWYAR